MKVNKQSSAPPWAAPKAVAFQKEGWRTRLYNSQAWRNMAKAEIAQEPHCAHCLTKGIVTVTNLQRDHVNGFANEQEFWDGKRQTLCKRCNSAKAGRAKASRGAR